MKSATNQLTWIVRHTWVDAQKIQTFSNAMYIQFSFQELTDELLEKIF
jgi:predicted Rdx family selenoprotein